MIDGKRITVVLPAFNAAKTLEQTIHAIDRSIADEVILVDDGSNDRTRDLARQLEIHYAFHGRNLGYGANQKTCYALALATGADVVVMLHPDYQYEPKLLPALAYLVASGIYDVAIGSRILGHGAMRGGMPVYKYVSNRALTFVQNVLIGQKLSEYHTGYRAFSRRVIETLPLLANSDDFVFDNQMLVQCHAWGFSIAEMSCPTKYFPEASSINFRRSVRYGLGTLLVSSSFLASRLNLWTPAFLNRTGAADRRLSVRAVRGRVVETNIDARD
jgi:glycosyltransferase involved in cell wall biosynthesis